MAKLATGDAALVATLCEGEVKAATSALEARDPLRNLYHDYLARFGERCLEELKLESPTLNDDAAPLVRAIGREAKRLSQPQAAPNTTGRQPHDPSPTTWSPNPGAPAVRRTGSSPGSAIPRRWRRRASWLVDGRTRSSAITSGRRC